MWCAKMFIFFSIVTLCKMEVKDKNQEQVSTGAGPLDSRKPFELKMIQSEAEKNVNIAAPQRNYNNGISNDIEVFKQTFGPDKENQDIQERETEEAKDVESEPDQGAVDDSETGSGLEENIVSEVEAEAASQVDIQATSDPTTAPENSENEGQGIPPATEVQQEEKEADKAADTTEMSNDEPAKEAETAKQADVSISKATDQMANFCFACTNSEEATCTTKPTKQSPCPSVNKGDKGKHNGCYTLHQVDTNVTMRGCVDHLAESGLRYCLTNEKLCDLCYSNGCNSKVAPSTGANLQLKTHSLLLLTTVSLFLPHLIIKTGIFSERGTLLLP